MSNDLPEDADPRERTMRVPIHPPDVFIPRFVDADKGIVTKETINHARAVALQMRSNMGDLPSTAAAGDLLAMVFAVLHFTRES